MSLITVLAYSTPTPTAAVTGTDVFGMISTFVGLLIGGLFGLLLYFAPTIIALLRRNRIAETMVLNLFLGWTLVGWVVSFVMAVSSKTNITISPTIVNPPSPQPVLSPDGAYWWDGTSWQLKPR